MGVPSKLFHFELYYYEIALKREKPDWFGRIFGEVPRDAYFIRRIPKRGTSEDTPQVLHATDWNSFITGERIYDWLRPMQSSLHNVMYFDTLEDAKLVIDSARDSGRTVKDYQPSQDSVYSTKEP